MLLLMLDHILVSVFVLILVYVLVLVLVGCVRVRDCAYADACASDHVQAYVHYYFHDHVCDDVHDDVYDGDVHAYVHDDVCFRHLFSLLTRFCGFSEPLEFLNALYSFNLSSGWAMCENVSGFLTLCLFACPHVSVLSVSVTLSGCTCI